MGRREWEGTVVYVCVQSRNEAHYFVGCSSFISVVIKHPDLKQLREQRLILHAIPLHSPHWSKLTEVEFETVGHITSTVKGRGKGITAATSLLLC